MLDAAGTQNFMLMASEADNGNLNGTQSDLLATWLGFCIRRLLFYIWMSCDVRTTVTTKGSATKGHKYMRMLANPFLKTQTL